MHFRSSPGLGPEALDGLPARVLECATGRVRLLSAEPETVLRELFRRGVAVADLEGTGADLEEAFLALTAGSQSGR